VGGGEDEFTGSDDGDGLRSGGVGGRI